MSPNCRSSTPRSPRPESIAGAFSVTGRLGAQAPSPGPDLLPVTGQFTSAPWTPFEHEGVQRLLPPAVLPAVVGQLTVVLRDTSLGFLITYEEFLHAGKLIASNLDYDLPFIPVVMVIAPIRIGMCTLLSWFAGRVSRRGQRSPGTDAVTVVTAGPGALLPGGEPPTAPRP